MNFKINLTLAALLFLHLPASAGPAIESLNTQNIQVQVRALTMLEAVVGGEHDFVNEHLEQGAKVYGSLYPKPSDASQELDYDFLKNLMSDCVLERSEPSAHYALVKLQCEKGYRYFYIFMRNQKISRAVLTPLNFPSALKLQRDYPWGN